MIIMDAYEHGSAAVTLIEQDGFMLKIHAQLLSDTGANVREVVSRIESISGHLRRVKCCESVSRGQLAFARIDDNFHRIRVISENEADSRVVVKYIDFGFEDVMLLSDITVVEPPLSDALTTIRPLADEFYLDGIMLHRPLTSEEISALFDKVANASVSCRWRRLSPDFKTIELATSKQTGDRHETLSTTVVELGFGKKCSTEDVAKYLRTKNPGTLAEGLTMHQPGRVFGNGMFSVPPPMHPTQGVPISAMPLLPQIVVPQKPQSSANDRLTKYKRDSGIQSIPIMSPAFINQVPCGSPLPNKNQSGGTSDGRTCTTAPTLQVESSHKAYISHVEDGPFHFIIQLRTSVEELLPQLRNILIRQPKSPVTTQLIPGSVVMAIGSDDCLRRGVIMSVQPEACKVYYIDYGNSEELSYSSIFQLPNIAAELSPAMALQFCMADLKGVKITEANRDYFARLLLGKLVHIRVTERESNSAFQYCEICWEGRNVRDILINLNSPMQYSNQYPPRGREAPISVIYVDGPSQFFVQYRSELATVTQIQEALASYCPSQPRVTDLSAISIGSPVASLFPEDQQWYRALVMGMDSQVINVFYVDYGNRAEVTPDNLCLLSRDLVNQWKSQAVECCLIGFDTVTPDLYMAEQMEKNVLGRSYTLRLHSILSGFRLNVDLVNDKGETVAAQMKEILNERQKHMYQQTSVSTEKVKPAVEEDDRTSQTSSDSIKRNTFPRPGTRGDRPPLRSDRNKSDNRRFEERPNHYSQHDDRAGVDYQQSESRGNRNRGPRKPYADAVNTGDGDFQNSNKRSDNWSDRPNFKRDEKRNDDKSFPQFGDGQRKDNDRRGNNRFERKPQAAGENNNFGSNRDRDNKWGNEREGSKYGGDRDNNRRDDKFGNRDNKILGNKDRGKKFGDKDKFGHRDSKESWDNKPKLGRSGRSNGFASKQSFHGATSPSNEDSWEDDSSASAKRSSVVISEYPHQLIEIGKEYKVFLAVMETSPGDVYIQLEGCDDELNKIRALIDADTTIASRQISNPVLAAPVLAKFSEDGLIYRATIKSLTKLSKGLVDVVFVDFGNTAVNPLSEIYSISSELMTIPIQAIRVKITDMSAIPSCNLDACKVHFQGDYITLKPTLTTSVDLEQVVEGTIVNVEGVSVASLIANDPLCSLRPGEALPEVHSPPIVEENPNVASSIPPLTPWVERYDLLVGQYLRAKIVKNVDDNKKYVKITSTLDLIVQTKCESTSRMELNPGSDVIIFVEGIGEDWLAVNYFDITGQSLTGDERICPILPMPVVRRDGLFVVYYRQNETMFLLSNENATVKLLDLLYEKYEGSSVALDSLQLTPGSLCAAKSLDGNWYRAEVKSVDENSLNVIYLDYGTSEKIPHDQIRPLDLKFMQPSLCVKARLTVSLKNSDTLNELNAEDALECRFISKNVEGDFWYVDLFDKNTRENLALKWLDASLAVEGDSGIPANPQFRDPGWDLKKGDIVPIVVTHYDSLDFFWAHLNNHIESVGNLFNKLQELPEGGERSEFGDIFVAKYTEDSHWYRAVQSEDCVRFIDYGNTDVAGEKKILPKDMILPIKGYAVPFHLCVKPASNDWTEEAVKIFDAFLEKEDGLIKAEILSVHHKMVVDLVCESERVSQVLIQGNLAVSDKKLDHFIDVDRVVEDEVPFGPTECFVSSVNSIKDFFVQECAKLSLLDELASLLEEADMYEDCANPLLDSYIIAKSPDDSKWYRAQVVAQEPLQVIFIDYGDISEVTECKLMPCKVASFPLFAWHCTADNKPFSEEEFVALVDSDETTFIVTFKVEKDNLHVVELSAADSHTLPKEPENTSVKKPSTFPLSPKVDKILYKNCCLTHANGPYDFYVQTDDDNIKIEEMSNALFEGGAFPRLNSVVKGDFVVAQFPDDDAYYRAIVTDVDPEVVVHFVDYGNSCPVSNFHELPSKLKEVPALALRCSLQSPIGGWSVDAIDKFSNALNVDTKAFNVKVLSCADPIIVDIEINGSSLTSELAPNAKFESVFDNEPPKIDGSKNASIDVKLSSSGICYIVHVDGDDVYVQDTNSDSDVELIAQHLSSVIISDESAVNSNKIRIGDIVVTDFEGSLSRASVSKLNPLEVYFIDYGNKAHVDKVYELSKEAKQIKPLAIKVKIDFGEGVKLSEEGYSELQISAVNGANYVLTAPSTIELTIDGTKAAELLESHLTKDETEGKGDEESTEIEVVAPTEPEQANTSEPIVTERIEPKSNAISEQSEVVTCSAEHDQIDQLLETEDSNIQPVPSDTENDSITESHSSETAGHESESFPVTISFVNSPSDFYYQVDSSKVEEVLSRLASAENELPFIADKCEVGQLICVKCDKDCQWYRAKVIESDPTIKVQFVDYGHSIDVKEMRQLPEDLLKLSPLCVKASLEIQDETTWTEKELEKFSKIAYCSSLRCVVIDDKIDVKIVRLSDSDGNVLTHLGRSCYSTLERSTMQGETLMNDTSPGLLDAVIPKVEEELVSGSHELSSTGSEVIATVEPPITLELVSSTLDMATVQDETVINIALPQHVDPVVLKARDDLISDSHESSIGSEVTVPDESPTTLKDCSNPLNISLIDGIDLNGSLPPLVDSTVPKANDNLIPILHDSSTIASEVIVHVANESEERSKVMIGSCDAATCTILAEPVETVNEETVNSPAFSSTTVPQLNFEYKQLPVVEINVMQNEDSSVQVADVNIPEIDIIAPASSNDTVGVPVCIGQDSHLVAEEINSENSSDGLANTMISEGEVAPVGKESIKAATEGPAVEKNSKQLQPIKKRTTLSDTKTRRSLPCKSVAEIKATAKARISTGRSTISHLKSTSPSRSNKSPQSAAKSRGSSSSASSSSKATDEKERLVPGVVSGHSWLH